MILCGQKLFSRSGLIRSTKKTIRVSLGSFRLRRNEERTRQVQPVLGLAEKVGLPGPPIFPWICFSHLENANSPLTDNLQTIHTKSPSIINPSFSAPCLQPGRARRLPSTCQAVDGCGRPSHIRKWTTSAS